VILHLHHRYRHPGGEERAVEDLVWLTREHLGESAEVLVRDSATTSTVAATAGLLGGGLAPDEVARAVRRTGARIVHAHNLHPTFGWRALAAARRAGARVVLHVHQYRLVCAVGVCFTEGADCTRCHGARTLPGIRHNCRGSRAESVVYAAALAAWQRRTVACIDAFVTPSRFAAERLAVLGAPVRDPWVLPHVVRPRQADPPERRGDYALIASRLAVEKGIETAIAACREAGLTLVIAGDGPERPALEDLARRTGATVRFTGLQDAAGLDRLRRRAAVALVPSRFAETFGLAAAEAMAAGLPVVATRMGALPEIVPDEWLCEPDDAEGMAAAIRRALDEPRAGARAAAHIRARTAPEIVAPRLANLYAALTGSRA
jgi:glycosyltransferase involved in cell wall biosynthesis